MTSTADAEDAGAIDDGVKTKPATSKAMPKKKVKKVRPDIKKVNPKPHVSCQGSEQTEYKANEYATIRREFINRVREDRGLSNSEASDEWNKSTNKRKLLAGLSVSELVRRRFVEKGCQQNPFTADGGDSWIRFSRL